VLLILSFALDTNTIAGISTALPNIPGLCHAASNSKPRGPMKRPKSAGRTRSMLSGCATLLLSSIILSSQNPQLETSNGRRFPMMVFTSVLWTADPPYYSVAVDSTGTATYQSAPSAVEKTGVPYTVEFAVSERTRRTSFNLARGLNFFRDQIPVSIGSPQNTSVRTLSYHDGQTRNQIAYTASPNTDVQELTSMFEELSETLEFGRRLLYLHENDRSALSSELEKLQVTADQHHVRELQALTTVLNNIVADGSLDLAARERAQSLLERARARR
jgi:hypothetical protein